MPEMNRRRFLIASAGAGAAGLLSTAVAVSWPDLLRAAQDRPLPPNAGVLVIVSLYGGNDGINTLIPYADNAYHDARPELAYASGDVLHLDRQLGLNPAMKGLAQLWNQRQLAIVRGVSYPQPDHSHFRSMDIWQTASPAEPVSTGWIGRWLDATGDDPTARSEHRGDTAPTGSRRSVHGSSACDGGAPGRAEKFDTVMSALGDDDPDDTPAMAAVCKAYRAAQTTDTTFASVKLAAEGHNSLATQLSMVANAVKARVPTRYTPSNSAGSTHTPTNVKPSSAVAELRRGRDPVPGGDGRRPLGQKCGLARIFGIRTPGARQRFSGYRSRYRRARIRRGCTRQGRLLRRGAQPDRPR
jgi:uncharacterized protein (DUF1501 family)